MLNAAVFCLPIISTHTLTWSVTDVVLEARQKIEISTHTLTWSVTFALTFIQLG